MQKSVLLLSINENKLNCRRLIESFVQKVKQKYCFETYNELFESSVVANEFNLTLKDLSFFQTQKVKFNKFVHFVDTKSIAKTVFNLNKRRNLYTRLFRATFDCEPEAAK